MVHELDHHIQRAHEKRHHTAPEHARESVPHHEHTPVLKKPRVAIHSLTGCAGCQLTIYFIKDILLDFLGAIELVAAPMIKGKNEPGPYDICFLEGSVSSKEDLEKLQELREQSKVLVAFGTCATHANVQGMKNFKEAQQVQEHVYGKNAANMTGKITPVPPTPLEEHVKIDYSISGCPPEELEILKFVKEFLIGMSPKIYHEPVCVECTKREINCLLEEGKECMGPLIRGGCNALCPSVNHGCTGCHGPIEEANIPQAIKLLQENNIPLELINKRMKKYAGLAFEKLKTAIKEAAEGK